MSDETRSSARLLRLALLGNAAFSALCAAALLVFSGRLAPHLGGIAENWLIVLGAGLVLFAGSLVWQAIRPSPSLFAALTTVIMDLAWVIATGVVLLLFGAQLSTSGFALVAGVAVVVATAGVAQLAGINHAIREPDSSLGTECRYSISRVFDVRREAMWPIIADLAAIHEHSRTLESSVLEAGGEPGPTAVRRCTSTSGATWREAITRWREGEEFDLRFLADDEGFPFPLNPMIGGWRLTSLASGRTRVTLWWSFTTQPRWAAPLIVSLIDRGARRDMVDVMRSMATSAVRADRNPT